MKNMKKIVFLFIFITLSFTALANNDALNQFSKIDTIKANITESSNINNKKRITNYDILANLPNQLKKVVISPEINKGEIYLYNGTNKSIYYPLLEQTITQKVDTNENYTLKFLKDLKTYNTNKNKDYKITIVDNQVTEIAYNDGVTIQFEDFLKINKINFPTHVKILDGKILISELLIKNIKINIPTTEKDFSANETN